VRRDAGLLEPMETTRAERIAVLNPMGFAPTVTRKALAPRLPMLDYMNL